MHGRRQLLQPRTAADASKLNRTALVSRTCQFVAACAPLRHEPSEFDRQPVPRARISHDQRGFPIDSFCWPFSSARYSVHSRASRPVRCLPVVHSTRSPRHRRSPTTVQRPRRPTHSEVPFATAHPGAQPPVEGVPSFAPIPRATSRYAPCDPVLDDAPAFLRPEHGCAGQFFGEH